MLIGLDMSSVSLMALPSIVISSSTLEHGFDLLKFGIHCLLFFERRETMRRSLIREIRHLQKDYVETNLCKQNRWRFLLHTLV